MKLSPICRIRIINKFVNQIESKIGNNNIYLLIGDPGSGKSVSLRKLCLELLKEVNVTGKTPVYINLQKWIPEKGLWSGINAPSEKDLICFIKKELYQIGDSKDFLDKYFEKMLKNGRWFFIFDSFDEMPCFMGRTKNDALKNDISKLLHDYLCKPNQSGGIIASRPYNRPLEPLKETHIIKIHKFDNSRIREVIKKSSKYDMTNTIETLFRDKMEFVELCRNPFYLSLLNEFLKNNNNQLPSSQYDLFKDYINRILGEKKESIEQEGLSTDEIYSAAKELSVRMQNDSNYGLDYPIKNILELNNAVDSKHWEKCLFYLEKSKMCRIGGNGRTVSFAHRRFQEFFFVEAVISGETQITENDYADILENCGIRDALVLYCQIANEENVHMVKDYCCNAIKSNQDNIGSQLNNESARLVNALYFLVEAFSAREGREKINNKDIEIIASLRKYLNNRTNYIVLLAIVNSMSLLEQEKIQNTLVDIFRLRNRWLNSAIVSKCQIIKKLNQKTEYWFCRYFEEMELAELLSNYVNVDFSLSLSECFSYIRKIHILMPFVNFSKRIARLSIILILAEPFMIIINNMPWILEVATDRIRAAYMGMSYNYEIFNPLYSELEKSLVRQSFSVLSFFMMLLLIVISILELLINFSSINKEDSSLESSKVGANLSDTKSASKKNEVYFGLVDYAPFLFNYVPILMFICLYSHKSILIYNTIILSFITLFYLYRFIHEVKITLNRNNYWRIIKNTSFYIFRFLMGIPVVLFIGLLVLIIGFILSIIFILGLLLLSVLVCWGIGWTLTVTNIIVVSNRACIILAILSMFLTILLPVRYYINDHGKLNAKMPDENGISREKVVANIDSLFFISSKREYVKTLIESEIKLSGSWPDNYSETIKDDVIIRDLALWDSKELSIKNYYSDDF